MGSGRTVIVRDGRRTRVADRALAWTLPWADAAATRAVVANHVAESARTTWVHP